jgi:hypothetical protein
MGAGGAADPASEARWQAAQSGCTRGAERGVLRALDGLPVERAAEDAAVARTGTWKIEIVRRCDKHKFVVLPKLEPPTNQARFSCSTRRHPQRNRVRKSGASRLVHELSLFSI